MVASILPGPAIKNSIDLTLLSLSVARITMGPTFSPSAHFVAMSSPMQVILTSQWALHSTGVVIYTIADPSGTLFPLQGTFSGSNPYAWTAYRPATGGYKEMSAMGNITPTFGNQYTVDFQFGYHQDPNDWDFKATVIATAS